MFSEALAGALELFLPRRPAAEAEAVRLLHAYLAAREVPMAGVDDLGVLVDTAHVFVAPDHQAALTAALAPDSPAHYLTAQLDQEIDAWEHRFARRQGRGGNRPTHVRLLPKENPADREPLRPLLRVLVAEFPGVRFFWLKTGVSLVANERVQLTFEELETDGLLVVGVMGFNHTKSDEEIRARVPEDFLVRKEVRGGRYAGRRCIHPVSLEDFVRLIRTHDLGLHSNPS